MNLADIIKSKAHATAYFYKRDWGLTASVETLSQFAIFDGSETYIKLDSGFELFLSAFFLPLQGVCSTTLVKYEVNISDDEGVGTISIKYENRRKTSVYCKTRKYTHYFNKSFDPNTQQELSDTQANEIKARNKKINTELNNIDILLNDQNEKFDTDLAKSKLDQLNEYQHKMSNNNKSRYKDLAKQQLQKELEMKKYLLQVKQDILVKIHEEFTKVNNEFQEARNHRNEIHNNNIQKLNDVIKQVKDLVKHADKKFNEAAAERKKYNEQSAEQLKITRTELSRLITKADNKLDEAQKDRQEKYESAKAQMNKVEQDVLKSRSEAEKRFNEAKARGDAQFKNQMQNFSELKENQQQLQKLIKEGFESAKQDRQKLYELSQEEREKLLKEVKESREEANKRFDEAKEERNYYAEKYSNAINQLDESQKQQFREAFEHRKEIYKKLDDLILKSRDEAEQRFDAAAADRDAKYQSTREQINNVEQEVQKSRAEANKRFDAAAADRDAKYQSTREQINNVEQEVQKSRTEVEEKLDKAEAERKKYYTQTETQLGITHAELLELRLQKDNDLKQLHQHMDEIYQATDEKLSNINQEVKQARKEVDANLKKAEKKLNNVYQATDEKLSNINQEVEQARKEVDANLKKASQHRDSVYQNTSSALDQMSNQQNNLDSIEFLLEQKKSIERELQETLESIKSESHEEIRQVKELDCNERFSQDKVKKYISIINTYYKEYKKKLVSNDLESALKLLDKGIKNSTHLAHKLVKGKYDFSKDPLYIKKELKKKYELKAKIRQSDLDSTIKKHLEEIELKNQTLELHVIDQEIFTGDAKSNKQLDKILTELKESWNSGCNAESAEKFKKARENFTKFRELSEKLQKIVTLKDAGDSLFNTALEQLEKAKSLADQQLALATFNQARQIYQEGEELDSRFGAWVESCRDMLTAIKEKINNNDISSNYVTEEIRDRLDDIYASNIEEGNTIELIGHNDVSTA